MKTVVATLGMKLRVVVSERNDPHKLDKNIIKRWIRDILYKRANLLVCQTNDAEKYFRNRGVNSTTVICNPIKQGLPKWNYADSNQIIINYCKLEKQKNIELLIESFELISKEFLKVELHIYGNGSEEGYLRNIIENKGLLDRIKIMPFNNDIHNIASKCFLYVSSSDYEGISNSMLEAMAMGMPVICTDCPIGGANMVINDGVNGFLVSVGRAEQLAAKIRFCLSNPNKMEEISAEAVKIQDKYSLRKITSLWEKII